MDNIEMKIVGNKLLIEVDLSQDFGKSSSGKTTVVASSRGNAEIPGYPGTFMGLNIYRKRQGWLPRRLRPPFC